MGDIWAERGAGEHEPAADDRLSPIEHEVHVAVSSARAWDAWVHGLTEWWHPAWTASGAALAHIEVEPHPGGRIVEHRHDGQRHEWGEVTDAVPGARFAHTFRLAHEGDASTVSVDFAEVPGGGTRVRLSHGGWNASNAPARALHADWPAMLERYRAHAQHI